MQVYKVFFKITKRYLGSICIYFGIFFLICLISIGSSNHTTTASFEAKKADIAIIDCDQTSYSRDLTAYLEQIENRKMIKDDTQTMQNELFHRNVDYILIIPKGYGDKIASRSFDHLTQNVKIPSSFSGTYIDNLVDHYMKTLKTYLLAGYDENKAFASTASALRKSANITVVQGEKKTGSYTNLLLFYQYFTYAILSIIITGLGPILLSFSNKDVASRMNASALSLNNRNLGLIAGSSTLALIAYGLFAAVSSILFTHQFFSIVGALCLINSLLYTIIAVAITFFISSFARSLNTFPIMANILGLGMSFLCGVFVPAEFMSKGVLAAGRLFPTYWYMQANNQFAEYASSHLGMTRIITSFCIEFLFFLVILGIGFVLTKHKRINA